ncbi:MAG: sigma 54-interacting transcriptional regulator, partial [Bradymonadaceae bacterium]
RREETVDAATVTIGAAEDNELVLDDSTVSRHHCRIVQRDERYLVEDTGSTNGTFIDGVEVEEAFLEPGSTLSVGNTRIEIHPVDEEVSIEPTDAEQYGRIVGRSVEMREIFGLLENIAPTSATVVVEGETGTGKEVVAQTIHDKSARSEGPFVVFDCGAVPENLVESELFGHEKGSFTGATVSREGLFETAEGGTIFLDELGELSLDLQPKLLRVLEEREIRRVGGNESIPVDVRVVAATNRKLEEEVEEGRFREDLFYRLSVVRLSLPPLRERTEDIAPLVAHFLEERDFNRDDDGNRRMESIGEPALEALQDYDWPGNVRELLNVVERACSFSENARIDLDDLPAHIGGSEESPIAARTPDPPDQSERERWTEVPPKHDLKRKPFKEAKQEWITVFERDYIAEMLVRHDGNVSQASREAEIDRKYFRTLMDKHGIERDDLE